MLYREPRYNIGMSKWVLVYKDTGKRKCYLTWNGVKAAKKKALEAGENVESYSMDFWADHKEEL